MRPPLLLFPVSFLLLFFAVPLGATLVAAGSASAWSWAFGDYVLPRLGGAMLQATLSTLLALALAVPLAWHHHRRALPWGKTRLALHAAPFVLPVFVVVGAVRELFGPTGWISRLVGTDLLTAMGPLAAVVLANAYYNYGFAARILHGVLEHRPHRLEAAARTLGASPARAFLRVVLPLLAPRVFAVAMLVWLFSFTSFGVVLLLGGSHVATLETLIVQNLGGVFPRTDRAAVLGILQLVLNLLLLAAYFRLQRAVPLPADPALAPRPAHGRDRLLSGLGVALVLAPLAAVLVGGFRVRGRWTLDAWRALLDTAHPDHLAGFSLGAVALRSVAYAGASTVLALALALSLAYGLRRRGGLHGGVAAFASLPLGTSSVLLGLGYLLAFGAGSVLDLRGAWIAIVLVHALVAFPFVGRVLLPALDQHDGRLDEAAALLGATPAAVVRRVHLPMLRPALVASAGMAAAISLGDFGASLLLMRPDTRGLAVWIGLHDRPFDAMLHAQAVALTAVLMVLAAGAYLVVERFRGPEAL